MAGVGLRLVAIGQDRIENMRAEARLGGVTAISAAVTKKRMEPTVGVNPIAKVVKQFDMAIRAAQRLHAVELVEIERGRVRARQSAKGMARYLVSIRVINTGGDRQLCLTQAHWRRKHKAL